MSLVVQIQREILDSSILLSSILRKARILAYQLDNQDFKTWVGSEIDGYGRQDHESFEAFLKKLPQYRIAKAELLADTVTRFHLIQNVPVKSQGLPDEATLFCFEDGIATLESYISQGHGYLRSTWPDYILEVFSQYVSGQNIVKVWKQVPTTFVQQIIETVRDRLLGFVLELERLYPDFNGSSKINELQIPQSQITYLVNNYIKVEKGGHMSTFDQRGQNVSGSQFNAARDINFSGIRNIGEFIGELEKLQTDLDQAIENGELDEDTATDAKYELTKALQQAKKPQPDKPGILSHLKTLKDILAGVASLANTTMLVTQAIQAIQQL